MVNNESVELLCIALLLALGQAWREVARLDVVDYLVDAGVGRKFRYVVEGLESLSHLVYGERKIGVFSRGRDKPPDTRTQPHPLPCSAL